VGQSRKLGSSLSDFEADDATLVMIVPHERCRVQWWSDKTKGKVLFLADPGFLVSSTYGVAFQMRIHTDTSNTPGTFVIDKQGVLRWSHIASGKRSWGDRPTIGKTLEQVKEFSK